MQYQVKCNNCGRNFKITTSVEARKVNCNCPYCGKAVHVLIPETKKLVPVHKTENDKPSAKRIWTTLLLLVVLLVGGVGGWYVYRQEQDRTLLAERLKQERRKAHRDSLMYIRDMQDKRRDVAQETEYREKTIEEFIKLFYLNVILESADSTSCKPYITETCRKKMRDAYRQQQQTNTEPIWHLFATDGDEHDLPCLCNHLVVSHQEGNWYKVRLVQFGRTEYRYIKVLTTDRNILIDDVI